MACPDQECHNGKERLEKCVDELKKEVVRKSTVRWIVGLSVTVILAVSLYSLDAAANAKDERSDNTKQIEVIKKDIEHIKESVKKIEGKQMTPTELLELMKRAVREAD